MPDTTKEQAVDRKILLLARARVFNRHISWIGMGPDRAEWQRIVEDTIPNNRIAYLEPDIQKELKRLLAMNPEERGKLTMDSHSLTVISLRDGSTQEIEFSQL